MFIRVTILYPALNQKLELEPDWYIINHFIATSWCPKSERFKKKVYTTFLLFVLFLDKKSLSIIGQKIEEINKRWVNFKVKQTKSPREAYNYTFNYWSVKVTSNCVLSKYHVLQKVTKVTEIITLFDFVVLFIFFFASKMTSLTTQVWFQSLANFSMSKYCV